MTVYNAAWVLPIADPPIADGWVSVEGGRVAGVGAGRRGDAVDLGRVVVLPALVNAHTHLELSYLRGQVPPAGRVSSDQYQARDPLGMAHGIFDRYRASLRNPQEWKALQAQFVGNRFEILNECIEAQIGDFPVRQATAALVVAYELR